MRRQKIWLFKRMLRRPRVALAAAIQNSVCGMHTLASISIRQLPRPDANPKRDLRVQWPGPGRGIRSWHVWVSGWSEDSSMQKQQGCAGGIEGEAMAWGAVKPTSRENSITATSECSFAGVFKKSTSRKTQPTALEQSEYFRLKSKYIRPMKLKGCCVYVRRNILQCWATTA